MRNLKKTCVALIIAALLSAMTACGGDTDPAITETTPVTESATGTQNDLSTETELVSETESESATETETETDAITETETETVIETESESETVIETDSETATETETEIETDSETETETEIELNIPFLRFDHKRLKSFLSGARNIEGSRYEDPDEGALLKLTAQEIDSDIYIAMNLKSYAMAQEVELPQAENVQYLVFRLKAENCTTGNFELLYGTGHQMGITGAGVVKSQFNNIDDDWQYVVFNMTGANEWAGDINIVRFDYQDASTGVGETLYITGMWFAANDDEMYALTRQGMEDPFVRETDPVLESRVDELLATPEKAPEVSNDRITAEHEDASLDLWFNHAYTKTPAEDITSTGLYTYTLRLAKNESEGTHLLLASQNGHNGLTVSVTDFANADGATLKTELMYGYYFDDVRGETMVDPIPWVREGKTFDLAPGRSYMYIIKATSAIDSPAGLYTAAVTVKDADGKEIKRAEVHAYVWNFALPEETTLKTQMDLSWYNIYVTHECWAGDDSLLYKNYYDLLLSNRVCAYSLPYNNANDPGSVDLYADERILEYLNNPRVTAFNPINWKNHSYTNDTIMGAYEFLSQKEEWLDKSYFYVVDEPSSKGDLDRINAAGEQLKQTFPGYKMLAPLDRNYTLSADCTEDYITYTSDSLNVWCYKPFFHTTYEEYCYNRNLTYRSSPGNETVLGTFTDRMLAAQAEGDEVWWYVTRRPQEPEITLGMDTSSIRHRILFWQQKLYNVDGFLYYLANDWYGLSEDHGLNKKHETNGGPDFFDCYGNGVLLYCGADFDEYGPVSSLRLENVRDGIEDFEYLTMLEDIYGEELTDALIGRLTTSIIQYNTDIDNFTDLRVALGNIIEETLTQNN